MDHAMKQLMFATDVWDVTMKAPLDVTPTLTFLREDKPAWVVSIMDKHDLGDLDLLRGGITPMIPMSVETSEKLLKPLLARMDVRGAVFVSGAQRVGPDGLNERVIMLWSYHLPTQSEVVWCRTVRDDGTVSGPVDLEDTGVVGVGWIKAAL